MAMTLCFYPGSPYVWNVMLALEYKGLSYDLKLIDFADSSQRSPEYLQLNPRGKVPTLIDGDEVITESLAIVTYLESKHPEPSLFGQSPRDKAHIMEALSQLLVYLEPVGMQIPFTVFWRPWDEAAQNAIRRAIKNALPEVTRIEQALSRQDWLVAGAGITAVDFRLYPVLSIIWRALMIAGRKGSVEGMELLQREHFPAIDRWCQRIEALPYYEKTYPTSWRKKA